MTLNKLLYLLVPRKTLPLILTLDIFKKLFLLHVPSLHFSYYCVFHTKVEFKKGMETWVWQHIPVMSVLLRVRQEDGMLRAGPGTL